MNGDARDLHWFSRCWYIEEFTLMYAVPDYVACHKLPFGHLKDYLVPAGRGQPKSLRSLFHALSIKTETWIGGLYATKSSAMNWSRMLQSLDALSSIA
jgi:hypothetical protein